jgi:hypothetical protein
MADAPKALRPGASASPEDRRRHARVALPLKARVLSERGQEHACIVVNASAGGALLKTRTPPAENEQVVLYIDEIGRFEGRVVRAGKHSFAVDYRSRRAKAQRTADALTAAANAAERGILRRAAPRIKQDAPATVVFEDGSQQACSILDISLTGASIQIEPRPPLGTTLTLGRMEAKVVRRHETGVGLVFSGPAKRMQDAIDAASDAPQRDGAAFATSFGRKGLSA